MTAEILKKVLAPLKLNQDKEMPRTQNDLLICFCQWTRVEKRDRRVIDGEEHNLNAGISKDCVDKFISYNAADELIATSFNTGDSADFPDDTAGGLIAAINSGKSTDSTDTSISNDAGDGLINTAIYVTNSTDCAEDTAGGFIGVINSGNSMDCADIKVSDDTADRLIDIAINADNSTDCSEDAAGVLLAAIDADVSMN